MLDNPITTENNNLNPLNKAGIEEFRERLLAFCTGQKLKYSLSARLWKWSSAKHMCTYGNSFSYIADCISEIDLPDFSQAEVLFAWQGFEYSDRDSHGTKYKIEFGYLKHIEGFEKDLIKSYDKSSLLWKAQSKHFANYIYISQKESDTEFIIIEYEGGTYLCLGKTRVFYYRSDGILSSNPKLDTSTITPELYFQKFEALRHKISNEVIESNKAQPKSSHIADILTNLQF